MDRESAVSAQEHLAPQAPDKPVRVEAMPGRRGFWWCLRNVPGDVFRYLYFMRFSLMLWIFLPTLALLDINPAIGAITRGILTPSDYTQWIFAGFTVVLPGWFALLAARIVCSYGLERFGTPVPPILVVSDQMESYIFFGAQAPGLVLLYRIAFNVVHEGEGGWIGVIASLFFGALLALAFWHVITILYYWTYDPSSMDHAHAFLVPEWLWLPLDEIRQLPPSPLLKFLHWALSILCFLGPGYQRECKLRPGHIVASLTLLCALILYIIMMPISAPVRLPLASVCIGIFSGVLALGAFVSLLLPSLRGVNNPDRSVRVRLLPVCASCFIFVVLLLGSLHLSEPRAFPVIAYIAILLIIVFWTLAGIAFFADCYRIPVFTLAVSLVLLINAFPAEHVFPARPLFEKDIGKAVPTPAEYVKRLAYDSSGNIQPVIIITASGGGIHAAAWTATVLGELEKAFGPRFHQHVLLVSTVSGGSVAGMSYLREYFAGNPFDKEGHYIQRMQQASQCSSLQAVAWGLTYPDALRAIFPWFYNLFPSLDRFDRGWALEMALERNLHDPACFSDKLIVQAAIPDPSSLYLNSLAALPDQLPVQIPDDDPRRHFPAFTFNATVVETGDRFLLSNYSAFNEITDRAKILPAASFLGVYSREAIFEPPIPSRGGYADIALSTAARLSASFTYVSPAARLPFEMSQGKAENAFHFVDGGYYDNDGTNSVIEFLRSASVAFPTKGKLPVLLIEIRNGYDIDDQDSPDSYAHQGNLTFQSYSEGQPHRQGSPADGTWESPRKAPGRWGPVAEIFAPPKAAIHAGFSSTTRRNRRELDLLKQAFDSNLYLEHVVFDYQEEIVYRKNHDQHTTEPKIDPGESEIDQPLSWHLTNRQQSWINGDEKHLGAFDRNPNLSDRQKMNQALAWFTSQEAVSASIGAVKR